MSGEGTLCPYLGSWGGPGSSDRQAPQTRGGKGKVGSTVGPFAGALRKDARLVGGHEARLPPSSFPRDTPPRLEPAEGGGFSSFTFGENGHYSCPVKPGWSPTSDPSHQDSAAISSDFWIYMGSFYLCTLAHLEPPPHRSL